MGCGSSVALLTEQAAGESHGSPAAPRVPSRGSLGRCSRGAKPTTTTTAANPDPDRTSAEGNLNALEYLPRPPGPPGASGAAGDGDDAADSTSSSLPPRSNTTMLEGAEGGRPPLTTATATAAQRLHAQIMGYVILAPVKAQHIQDWVEAVSGSCSRPTTPEDSAPDFDMDAGANAAPAPPSPADLVALTSFSLRRLNEGSMDGTPPLWVARDHAPRVPSFNESLNTFGTMNTMNQSNSSIRVPVHSQRSMQVEGNDTTTSSPRGQLFVAVPYLPGCGPPNSPPT